MAHDYETERRPAETEAAAPSAATSSAPPATAFSASGSIPAVDTAAVPVTPSASDRAFGPAKGPGLQAIEALLGKGTPEPAQVVAVIDAHRDERAAILAQLESTLG